MKIILSIKPKFCDEIRKEHKLFEFRKFIIKDLSKIYVYETSPIKKITLILDINGYIEDTPQNIWNKCKSYSGISEKEFFEYFNGKKKAIAYIISSFKNVDINPNDLIENFKAPQSFIYIKN